MPQTERLHKLFGRLSFNERNRLKAAAERPGSPVAVKNSTIADRFWLLLVELGWAEHSHRVRNPDPNCRHYAVTRVGATTVPRLLSREGSATSY